MKISAAFLASLIALPAVTLAHDDHDHGDHDHGDHDHDHEQCTHGKLYVLDDTTSDVHVFDVSEAKLEDLTVETTITLPSEGAGGLVYYGNSADPLVVQYRGTEDDDYDGFVRVIDTGFTECLEYEAPSVAQNAIIDDCHRPVHQVRHDDKIAIFCDGAYDAEPQENTTIYVIDETKIGSSESAIVNTVELQGAHHGVAIPVDDGHLLHSLPLSDRINRVPNTTSLPATFQVVDSDGNVLHELSDTTNPDTHCSGFHGSASLDNTFALACDAAHGGIVIVEYDPSSNGYTSRALSYPDDPKYESFRVGSFAYHKKSGHLVGSFTVRDGTEFHLVALSATATALEESNVLTLPGNARQCGYQFEVGQGEHLLVFMPNGVLHAFKVENEALTQVAQKEIVSGMTACSEAAFVAGIGQAFIATPATKTMYAVDLSKVDEGEMVVYESTLPFTPTGMIVSGFSEEAACGGTPYEKPADCPSDAPDDEADGSGATVVSIAGLFVAVACIFAI